MDLKKFLPIQNRNLGKNNEEYFWALLIEPNFVQVGAWRVVEGIVQVSHISPAIAWGSFQDLVDATDSALSSVVSELPSDAKDPVKTVFGVANSWLADGVIKPDYLSEIKSLCEKLGLKPIGFVVLPEAIALYLKYQERSAVSAIFVGCYKEFIEISVFKLGNLIGVTLVSRSVALVEDVVEGLARFTVPDGIPSRIVLYNGKESELEEARQDLLASDWTQFIHLKLIHQPKIEVFLPDEKIKSVSFAGGVELTQAKGVSFSETTEFDDDSVSKFDTVNRDENVSVLTRDELENLPPSHFGFSGGSFNENIKLHKNVHPVKDETLAFDSFGKLKREIYSVVNHDDGNESAKDNLKPTKEGDLRTEATVKILEFPKLSLTLPPFLNNLFLAIKMPVIVGIIVLLAVFAGGFVAWWYYPTAEVVIYVSSRNLDEKMQITVVSEKDSENFDSKILSGNIIKTSVSGRKTKETTGSKTIGDKAKGEVTLYRVGPQLTLKSGTVLTGPGGLKFTIDNDVVVASGSASSPSESKVSVSAVQIGPDYNLASGASFSVSNYSVNDIEAKNENAFSGGTSREVSSVSSNDHKELNSSLTEELVLTAKSELEKLLSADELYVQESLKSTVKESRFSHPIGAEAESVELALDLTVSAVTISRSKISELAMSVIESKIPEGFILRPDQIDFSFKLANSANEKYVFDVSIVANLLPQVDPRIVAQKIKGKYPSMAEEILQNEVAGYVRAEIKSKPKLPGRLGTLPQMVKNIDVQVAAER